MKEEIKPIKAWAIVTNGVIDLTCHLYKEYPNDKSNTEGWVEVTITPTSEGEGFEEWFKNQKINFPLNTRPLGDAFEDVKQCWNHQQQKIETLQAEVEEVKSSDRRSLKLCIQYQEEISQLKDRLEKAEKAVKFVINNPETDIEIVKHLEESLSTPSPVIQKEEMEPTAQEALEWLFWKVNNEEIQVIKNLGKFLINIKPLVFAHHKEKTFMNSNQFSGNTIIEAIRNAMKSERNKTE